MWDKAKIHALLDKSDKAVMRALSAIYALQTADEKASEHTSHSNSVGFSAFDAKFCSSLAQRVNRGYGLTPAQLAPARNKMKRYHRQLCDIANAKEARAVEFGIESAAEVVAITVGECDCENYDGEMKCPACQVKDGVHEDIAWGNGFGYQEAKFERRCMS